MTTTEDPQAATPGPLVLTLTAIRYPVLWRARYACRHGFLEEGVATNSGMPSAAIVGPSGARNLKNVTQCDCVFTPS